MTIKLDKEEQDLLDSYENDEWVPVSSSADLEKYQLAAKTTFKKDKRVNIRISDKDRKPSWLVRIFSQHCQTPDLSR